HRGPPARRSPRRTECGTLDASARPVSFRSACPYHGSNDTGARPGGNLSRSFYSVCRRRLDYAAGARHFLLHSNQQKSTCFEGGADRSILARRGARDRGEEFSSDDFTYPKSAEQSSALQAELSDLSRRRVSAQSRAFIFHRRRRIRAVHRRSGKSKTRARRGASTGESRSCSQDLPGGIHGRRL